MMADKSNVPYDTISRTSVSTQCVTNKCCFYVPLKTGCFIIGYLNLVINCFETLNLIGFTVTLGIMTHGFDHYDKPRIDDLSDRSFISSLLYRPTLSQMGFILAVLMIVNLSWIVINVACLVGLHKRKPGPIRVYVGFATARLVLSLARFIYGLLVYDFLTFVCIDLGLPAYSIIVYCIYANRLDRERETEIAAPAPINNVYIYPTKLDKSHLVSEEKKGGIEA